MAYNKEQRRQYQAEWCKKNPEKVKASKKKYNSNNREKNAAQSKAWRLANPQRCKEMRDNWIKNNRNRDSMALSKVRQRIKTTRSQLGQLNRDLRTNYGVTLTAYKDILSSQGGVCAICGNPPMITKRSNRLFVDHDHKTGRLRALLCHFCNAALGYLREDISLMHKAAAYVEAFGETNVGDWTSRVRFALDHLSKKGGQEVRAAVLDEANLVRAGTGANNVAVARTNVGTTASSAALHAGPVKLAQSSEMGRRDCVRAPIYATARDPAGA